METNADSQSTIGLYFLLARLLNEEINPEIRDFLLQPEVFEIFNKAEPDVDQYLNRDWNADDYEAVAADYCNAFVLPKTSKVPRAIAWLEEGASVSADGIHAVVEAFVKEWHLTLPEEYAKLPYDHASLLLVVAALLHQNQCPQVEEFEANCLATWLPKFGKALIDTRTAPVYRSVGQLLIVLGG